MADPDITAAEGLLLAAWRRLPMAQRTALRRSTPSPGSRRLQADTNARTVKALHGKHLTGGDAGYGPDPNTLTPTAVLLRAVGMRDEAQQAKRRFRQRRNTAEKVRA